MKKSIKKYMMNTRSTTKAVKKSIKVAGIDVDVFQMPDGSYQYSQTSVAKAIGKARNSLLDFSRSKRLEALPYKGLTLLEISYEGHHIPVKAVPGELATVYWHYWANKGSAEAQALTLALTQEALERRADAAFGVSKAEELYEAETQARYEAILKMVRRKTELSHNKDLDAIRKDDRAYQALLAEERSLKDSLSYVAQDLSNCEYNIARCQAELERDTVSEIRAKFQRMLDYHLKDRDRLIELVRKEAKALT